MTKTISEINEKVDANSLSIENLNQETIKIKDNFSKHVKDFDDYVYLADQTFATKDELLTTETNLKAEIKLKADKIWVEEELDLKSDKTHDHDDKYLPIKNANMQGEPTTTTPAQGDISSRVANTEWTAGELSTLEEKIDAAKLDKMKMLYLHQN